MPSNPTAAINAKDVEVMTHVLKNVIGKLNVNWQPVVDAMGYKNANVAKVRWTQVMKKLTGSPDGGVTNELDGEAEAATPMKISKNSGSGKVSKTGTPSKGATVKKESAAKKFKKEEDSDEDRKGAGDGDGLEEGDEDNGQDSIAEDEDDSADMIL